jgi:hypothetical protein
MSTGSVTVPLAIDADLLFAVLPRFVHVRGVRRLSIPVKLPAGGA